MVKLNMVGMACVFVVSIMLRSLKEDWWTDPLFYVILLVVLLYVLKKRIYMYFYGDAKAAKELKKWEDTNCGKPYIIFVKYKKQVIDVNFGIIQSFDHYVEMAKESNTMDMKHMVEAKCKVPVKEQHYIRGRAAKFGESTLWQEKIKVGTTYVLVSKATWIMYALPVMISLPLRAVWTLYNIIELILEFECNEDDVYDLQAQIRKLYKIIVTMFGMSGQLNKNPREGNGVYKPPHCCSLHFLCCRTNKHIEEAIQQHFEQSGGSNTTRNGHTKVLPVQENNPSPPSGKKKLLRTKTAVEL